MEAQYLKIILLLVGGLIAVGLFYDSYRRKRMHQRRFDNPGAAMGDLPMDEYEDREVGDVIMDDFNDDIIVKKAFSDSITADKIPKPSLELTPKILDEEIVSHIQEANVQEPDSLENLADDVIMINVIAGQGRRFVGYEMLQAILAGGLAFGQMNMFHRHKDPHGRGTILYTLANCTEKGTFDMNNIGGFACQGLMLFMRFPNVHDTMAIFDLMLNNARQIADDLDGMLVDQEFKPLTEASIQAYKEHISSLEKGQLTLDLMDA